MALVATNAIRHLTTMVQRTSEQESQKERPDISPHSSFASQETASVENCSMTSSLEVALEPKWPRTWRAYTCWLGCFFLMFNSWGLVNAYGTFSSYYVGNSLRDSDQLRLNLIGSTQSFLVLLFSAPVGKLLDAGHFRYVVLTGSILVPFGLFMLSIAHPTGDGPANFGSIWATQGLVVGLGMACFFVSSSQSTCVPFSIYFPVVNIDSCLDLVPKAQVSCCGCCCMRCQRCRCHLPSDDQVAY